MISLMTRPDSVPLPRPNKIRATSTIKIMSTIGSTKHQSSRTTRLYPSRLEHPSAFILLSPLKASAISLLQP
jgi:hypothetical protein